MTATIVLNCFQSKNANGISTEIVDQAEFARRKHSGKIEVNSVNQ